MAYDSVVLARTSQLHIGAEIEAAFSEALHKAFTADPEPNELDLGEVLCDSMPLSTTMNEAIARLRTLVQGAGAACHACE